MIQIPEHLMDQVLTHLRWRIDQRTVEIGEGWTRTQVATAITVAYIDGMADGLRGNAPELTNDDPDMDLRGELREQLRHSAAIRDVFADAYDQVSERLKASDPCD